MQITPVSFYCNTLQQTKVNNVPTFTARVNSDIAKKMISVTGIGAFSTASITTALNYEDLLEKVLNNPERVSNLLTAKNSLGSTIMHLGNQSLSSEDIKKVNNAFVKANSIEILEKIHSTRDNNNNIPFFTYDNNLKLHTLEALKERPAFIRSNVEDYYQEKDMNKFMTDENLLQLAKINKNSPETIAELCKYSNLEINKDNYEYIFNTFKEVPEVIVNLPYTTSVQTGNVSTYFNKFCVQLEEHFECIPYTPEEMSGMMKAYVNLALNSSLDEKQSYDLLKKHHSNILESKVLTSEELKQSLNDLSNMIEKEAKEDFIKQLEKL